MAKFKVIFGDREKMDVEADYVDVSATMLKFYKSNSDKANTIVAGVPLDHVRCFIEIKDD